MEAGEGEPRARPRRRLARRAALLLLLLGAAALLVLDRRLVAGFGDGRCRDRVRIYAAPRRIAIGMHLEQAGVFEELAQLGYRAVSRAPQEPGSYRRSARRVELHLRQAPRPASYGNRPAERVDLEVERGRVSGIVRVATGERVDHVELEPRALEGVLDDHWTAREPLSLDAVPAHVVDAALAAEDARFLNHPGLDLGSLARALRVNWKAGEVRQGGSTITQQLVKNHLLTQDRTFLRKLQEVPMALLLEWRFSKREILECYLATVYLGHDRLVGVYGIAEAARVYFGKDVSRLSLGEAATLAGMIRSPNPLSPLRHPARAAARRDQVLGMLEHLGWIGAGQAAAARAERLPAPAARAAAPEAYFLGQVLRELDARALEPRRLAAGSAVFTTLDARLQRIAHQAVRQAAEQIDRLGRSRRGVQAAVVALDAESGALRALVGGRDYLKSQLDRATQVRRPVGSLFKPFVYLAALDDPASELTAATLLRDDPLVVHLGAEVWSPRNHDGRFRGPVTARTALEQSLNVPTVRVMEELGIERVASFGELLALGRGGLPRLPSLALGAFSASLLDVASSYTVFPGRGRQATPRAIDSVKVPSGVLLARPWPARRRVVAPPAAYVVHAMLEGVVERGTGRGARGAGSRQALAGKTGTTSDDRDAWFVGYTPSLVIGVWVGYDDDRSLPGGAAQIALPLWTAIARRALAGEPREAFVVPRGVDLVRVEAASGRLDAPGCGPAITEAFVAGTAPKASCVGEPPRQAIAADADLVERARRAAADLLAALPEALRALLDRLRPAPGRPPPRAGASGG